MLRDLGRDKGKGKLSHTCGPFQERLSSLISKDQPSGQQPESDLTLDKEPIIHDGVEPVVRPMGDRNIMQLLEDM